MPTITIGIVTYNSARFLPKLIESIHAQTFQEIELRIWDNGSTDTTVTLLQELVPDAHLHAEQNIGFGRAHNRLMQEAQGSYYLCLNPDIVMEPDCLELLLQGLEAHPECAVVGPKLYSMDPVTLTPTTTVDSIGLAITRSHKVYDIGSGEADHFAKDAYVFGISGALFLLRLSAAWDVALNEDVFDPEIFMYKEDVDLAYRLQLANYQAYFVASAHAYHVRSTPPKGFQHFFKKSKKVIVWSATHHVYQVCKNMPDSLAFSVRFSTYVRLWIIALYTLWFSPRASMRIAHTIVSFPKDKKTPLRTSQKRLEDFFGKTTIETQ